MKMVIVMDRLDFFEGYIKNHRDHIIKDLTKLENKTNIILRFMNEARLSEMDHMLDVIDDINRKTIGKRKNDLR